MDKQEASDRVVNQERAQVTAQRNEANANANDEPRRVRMFATESDGERGAVWECEMHGGKW